MLSLQSLKQISSLVVVTFVSVVSLEICVSPSVDASVCSTSTLFLSGQLLYLSSFCFILFVFAENIRITISETSSALAFAIADTSY